MQLHAPNPTPADNELDQLYRRYAPVMYRTAFQILGEHGAAEDVVGEVILRLVKARRRPVRPGRNYFIKAARNEALHALKRSGSWPGFIGAFSSIARDRDPGPEIDFELAEERDGGLVWAVIADRQ